MLKEIPIYLFYLLLKGIILKTIYIRQRKIYLDVYFIVI
jgi:hypothetical protein